MIIRSRAPLRIGLAGGGTDVSPYADEYGGSILNATVNMHAYASIVPLNNGKIEMEAFDLGICEEYNSEEVLDTSSRLSLHNGVYNRIVKDFSHKPLSFRLSTSVDAPPGSGLGSSSTLVVAIIGAFVEWLNLPLGEYDIAHLAYEIERIDLGLAGGRQDQYAATFGGFNFMEFYKDDKVIVNPLRIKRKYAAELEHNLVLFYTGTSRESARIIEKQTQNISDQKSEALEATHKLKEQSVRMKEAMLTGNVHSIGEILHYGWEWKKKMAAGISNPEIDAIYDMAMSSGATGGKISGAGGGGFFFFYAPHNKKHELIDKLANMNIHVQKYLFTQQGLYSYTVQD